MVLDRRGTNEVIGMAGLGGQRKGIFWRARYVIHVIPIDSRSQIAARSSCPERSPSGGQEGPPARPYSNCRPWARVKISDTPMPRHSEDHQDVDRLLPLK